MSGDFDWKDERQLKEKRERRAEKDIGARGDEWERPKEGQHAKEDDWGEEEVKYLFQLLSNFFDFFIEEEKSEQVFLTDSLPQKWDRFHFFAHLSK